MKFHPTSLDGAYTIEPERNGDDRGFFARVFCENEFGKVGLMPKFVQVNDTFSGKRGTLRGMHYQLPPKSEARVVRCIGGSLWDAILDLRPDLPSFGKWFGAQLSAENRLMMYVPRGFAHATLTLTDNTEVFYLVSEFYGPEQELGIRWNDPTFKIAWPIEPAHISLKDASWPDFDPCFHGVERLRGL